MGIRVDMKNLDVKKWSIATVVLLIVLFTGMALLTYIVDPYFHYHKPIDGIHYRLYEQRYINDGISRHFEYDAVITGNSLSENTKTSEFDELFDCSSIKLPYSGAGFKELWSSLDRTLSYNPDVKKVLVIMDYDDINRHKDFVRYLEYPDYLYDDNIWNDGSYLWNKEVFYRGTIYNLLMTIIGKTSTTFDEYSAWEYDTGAEVVMPLVGYICEPEEIVIREYEEERRRKVEDNININIINVTRKYPDVQFYLVYSPSSIAKWCRYYNSGEVSYRIEGSRTAAELLLQEKNIQLYSFLNDYEMICDLDNYRDTIHYDADINSYMLKAIATEKNRLALENYEDHLKQAEDFYLNYDYRSLAIDERNLVKED